MRGLVVTLLAALGACGRVGFDARVDAGGGDAEAPDAPGPARLVLHLPLDGNLTDVAGGNPVSCTGCPSFVPGAVGQAAYFDGTACLRVASSPALSPATITIAVWAKLAAVHADSVVGRGRDEATTSENVWEVYAEGDGTLLFGTHDGAGPRVLAALAYPIGAWFHLAATFDGTTKRLYINGAEVTAGTAAPLSYAPGTVTVGCDLDLGGESYPAIGAYDDVRIYDGALSAAEIAALAL